MEVATILEEAKALISDERRWTKELYARDANGMAVSTWHETAVCWCSVGAIRKVGGIDSDEVDEAGSILCRAAAELEGTYDAIGFNDHHTHAEVMKLFDLAIRMAKGETWV